MPNTIDGKSIRCPSCGEYNISGSVYDTGKRQKLGSEQRRKVLDKAKLAAVPGKPPLITTPTLSEI